MKMEEGNADSKWRSEKKMEGECVRTVDCLRGRLLAERLASRNANEEAELLGHKLIELENLLKQEAKSRNRAEKKLKSLLKKLESRNISYVSDESEHSSGLRDKSDISPVSSTSSSRTKQPGEEKNDKISTEIPETEERKGMENGQQNNSQFNLVSHIDDDDSSPNEGISSPERTVESESHSNEYPVSLTGFEESVAKSIKVEDSLNSTSEENLEKSSQLGCDQNCDDSTKIIEQSVESSNQGRLTREQDHQDPESDHIDNSMALVPVDVPQKAQRRIDPEVLDATVKEVLDALRHAKEQLQNSMERQRRMNIIKVG